MDTIILPNIIISIILRLLLCVQSYNMMVVNDPDV